MLLWILLHKARWGRCWWQSVGHFKRKMRRLGIKLQKERCCSCFFLNFAPPPCLCTFCSCSEFGVQFGRKVPFMIVVMFFLLLENYKLYLYFLYFGFVEMQGVFSFVEIGENVVKARAISIWMIEFCFWTWWNGCETYWLLNMTNNLIMFFTSDLRNKICWHDIGCTWKSLLCLLYDISQKVQLLCFWNLFICHFLDFAKALFQKWLLVADTWISNETCLAEITEYRT